MKRRALVPWVALGALTACVVATCGPKRAPAVATVVSPTMVLVQKLPAGTYDVGVVVSWDMSGGLMVLRYVQDNIFANGFDGPAGGGAYEGPYDDGGHLP